MNDKVVSFEIKINGISTQINNAKELEETLKLIKKAAKDQEFGSDELKNFNDEQAKLQFNQKKIRDEIKKTVQQLEAQENSYKGLAAQQRILTNDAKDYAAQQIKLGKTFDEIRNNDDVYKVLRDTARRASDEIKALDADLGDHFREVGNYPQIWTGAFGGVLGAIPNFVSDLEEGLSAAADFGVISKNFAEGAGKGLSSVAKTLTNPLVLGLTAATALGNEAFQAIRDITLEYEKLFSEVNKTTGLVGQSLVENTARLSAASETFDQDFGRILQSANNAAQGFDRDFGDVLDNIELGLLNIASGDAQDEFLDSFREYPQLIDSAGFSLEEFTKLAVASSKRGIFSDKLIDSIKEGDLSLKEFTKTQKDALEGVLGGDFTNDLEKRIRSGVTSSKDAILEIGDQLEASGADLQDYATITADVFKGAGEDVGGFGEILEIVRDSTEELTIPTDAYTQRLLEQKAATEDLELQQARLAATFAGTGTSLESVTTRLKAFGATLLNDVIETFRVNSRILSEDGFLGALLGGRDKFKEVADEIRQEDADALAEVEKGRDDDAERQRKRDDAALKAKRQQAKAIKEVNDQIEKDRKEAEAAAKFALENPEGSINLLENKIKQLRSEFGRQTTNEGRTEVSNEIDEITNSIRRLKEESTSGVREIIDLPTIDSGANVVGSIEQESETETEGTRVELEKNANEQIEETRQEHIERLGEIEQEAIDARIELVANASEAMGEFLGQVLTGQIEDFEDFRNQFLGIALDLLEGYINTQIATAVAGSLAQADSIATFGASGGIRAAILTGLIRAAFAAARSALLGEHGLMIDQQGEPVFAAKGVSVDRYGRIIGPSHPNGGVDMVINGRRINGEGGEHKTEDEYGNGVIINKKSSDTYKGVLGATKNMTFAGKSLFLDLVNRAGGGSGFINPNTAMEGGFFTAAPANFSQELELSKESISELADANRIATRQGTREGSSEGIKNATEQAQRLEDIKSLREF